MSARLHFSMRACLGLAVFLLAVAVYANTLQNGFAMDDEPIIFQNERAHGLEHVAEAVTSPYWPGSTPRLGLYRPLTVATFAVDWELWGGNPRGFHGVNVLLHGAVTLLVFALMLQLGFSGWAGAVGAAIFAVHPVHTEAVANVVGRAELLAALFFLGGCILYLRRILHPALRVPGVALCYFLSLGAKEIGVTLPAVLLLLEALWVDRSGAGPLLRRLRREAPVYLALILAAVGYLALRSAVLGVTVGTDVAPVLDGLSTADRLANAIRIWPEYVRLLVFPRHLVADYSPAVIMPVSGLDPLVVLGLAVGFVTLLLGVAAWRHERISTPIFWFAITIFPVSNLFIPVGILLAERNLYLPSVAVAFVVAAVVARFRCARPALRGTAAVAGGLVLILASWWTWQRNPAWRSTETIIQDLARTHPESFRVQWVRGSELLRQGRVEEGLHLHRRAVELAPTHYTLLFDYGLALVAYGRAAEAESVLNRAAALIPEYPLTYALLSQSLLNQQRPDDALRVTTNALARFEDDGSLYHQQALAYAGLGQWDAARTARIASLRLTGPTADWTQWRHLAEIEYRRGRLQEAANALARARTVAPPEDGPALTFEAFVAALTTPRK